MCTSMYKFSVCVYASFLRKQWYLSNPFLKSLKKRDAKTAQSLLVAGADVGADDACMRNFRLSLRDVRDDDCRDLLEHHAYVLAALDDDPNLLVSAAVEYCAALADSSKATVPATRPTSLLLRAFHRDPSLLWAPREVRRLLFEWARNVLVVQQAASNQLFSELTDDCAGDVLDFLQVSMSRTESLHVATCCSSPEAQAWVRAVVVAAVLVRFFAPVALNVSFTSIIPFFYVLFSGKNRC